MCNTNTVIAISQTVFILSYVIQTWHNSRHMLGMHTYAGFDDLDLDARS